jgi:periplasmic protein CpxP/Spy
MKKLIIILALGLSLIGFAQETTPQQRQQKYLAHLTKELNLDAKQQEAVGKIIAEKSAKSHDLKAKADAKKAKGEKLTAAEETALKNKLLAEKADTEAKMKAVLSADQFKKWLTIRAQNKEKLGWE